MYLETLRFDQIDPSDRAALELAEVWFPTLSGSVESRMAQASAKRWLTSLIRAEMDGVAASRTVAHVVVEAKRRLRRKAVGGTDLGLETLLLNVSDARFALHAGSWNRTLSSLSGRPRLREPAAPAD